MFSFLSLDARLLRWINIGWASPALDGVMAVLTFAGEYSWAALLIAPFAWARGGRKFRRFGAMVVPLVFLSDSLPNLLKLVIGRDRPFVTFPDLRLAVPVDHLSDFGFPSNHAANVFAVAVLASLVFGRRAAAATLPLAALVALSRVYLGVHYPGDVIGGAALGAALAVSVNALYVRAEPAGRRTRLVTLGALMVAGIAVQLAWRLLRGF